MMLAIGFSVMIWRLAVSGNCQAPTDIPGLYEYDVFSAFLKHADSVKRELGQSWARWEATVLTSDFAPRNAEHSQAEAGERT